MKKILMVCTKYPELSSGTWLTSELAAELVYRGYDVDVLCIDWSSSKFFFRLESNRGVNILRVSPVLLLTKIKLIRLSAKWFFSSFFALILSFFYFPKRYDLFISYSPCVATWFANIWYTLISKKSLLIYWDFFPVHNQEIGMLKSGRLISLLKKMEKFSIRGFDNVACMSQLNCRYFENYFSIVSPNNIFELPVWGKEVYPESSNEVQKFISSSSKYCIFGGQLEKGRGVECVVDAAIKAKLINDAICTIIIGSGSMSSFVQVAAQESNGALVYMRKLPRPQYMNLLKSCSVGIVATVRDVSVPTYPSKSIDYMVAKLPIVASIEESTDFGSILLEYGAGIVVPAGDATALAQSLVSIIDNKELRIKMGSCAYEMFKTRHDLNIVVDKLLQMYK